MGSEKPELNSIAAEFVNSGSPVRIRPSAQNPCPSSDDVSHLLRLICLATVVLAEDLSQSAREFFGFAGVAELAPHEAAVVTGKHGRLLTEPFRGSYRGAPGE